MHNFLKRWLLVKDALSILFCGCMMAGFMWSRALLSMSVILFFLNSLHPDDLLKNWRSFKKDFFAIACLVFFLAYFISGLWSSDKGAWVASVVNELPFLILPFAFFSLPLKQIRWQRILVFALVIIHFAVVFYSLGALVTHFEFYVHSYKMSHSLPTTKYDDHIRFSLSLVATLVIVAYFLFENKSAFSKRGERLFLQLSGIIFFIYLHLLASKTGLLTVYLFLFLFAFYFLRKRAELRKFTFPVLVALLLLPVALYFVVPTFKEKINYVKLESRLTFSKDTLNYNYSDAGRIISYKMAAKVWQEHKWIGTGVGDLRQQMDKAYEQNFPKIPAKNRLIPHSQYFYDFTALGLLFGVSILILCIAAFWLYPKPMFYGRITAFIMIVAMMAEAMLEVQFGVFVFLFFLLFWKNMPEKKQLIT